MIQTPEEIAQSIVSTHTGLYALESDRQRMIERIAAAIAAERERAEKAEAERDAIGGVMGRMLGSRFLDPPDGGDVPLPEQVLRLCEALQKVEAELERWKEIAANETRKCGRAECEAVDAREDALREGARLVLKKKFRKHPVVHEIHDAILSLIDKEPTHD